MKATNHRRRIRDARNYFAVLCVMRFFCILPRKTGIAIARFLARVYYALNTKHRKNTINHLSMALGKEKTPIEIRKIARNVFLHFATVAVDTMRIPDYIKAGMERYISVKDLSVVEEARAKGKGIIFLTGHFGNWELMGAYMAALGYPLVVVSRASSNPAMDRLISDMRNNAGYYNIPRGKSTREILKALKKGYALGILIDQDTKVRGVFVDFFGQKAHTPVGPILLAKRFDIPIIPIFMYLLPDLTYTIECLDPVELVDTGDVDADLIANVQKCSDAYERIIRRYPDQWAWFHRRWKTRPTTS
ncbi:MAG: lysophospholipid acyltransferase family protein [Deltaproteobacteria bacterium]|nr:lysophospholipid acyltransferase family protein [Deltaproteobacteria bacterium]